MTPLTLLKALKSRVVRRVRAVVVLPVKDLAVQVYKVFQAYVHGTELKVGGTVMSAVVTVGRLQCWSSSVGQEWNGLQKT